MSEQRVEFLLVEDNDHDIIAIKRAFKQTGLPHRLLTVAGGVSCLQFLNDRVAARQKDFFPPPLVLLLNDHMATSDGIEILKEIRSRDDLCHLPVVMLMASSQNYREMKSYRTGANAYIVKPFEFETLVSVMDLIVRFWELAELPEPLVGA